MGYARNYYADAEPEQRVMPSRQNEQQYHMAEYRYQEQKVKDLLELAEHHKKQMRYHYNAAMELRNDSPVQIITGGNHG